MGDSALGFESSKEEVREIAETVDPDDEGFVAWKRFLEVAALKMKCGCLERKQVLIKYILTTSWELQIGTRRQR